MDHCPPPDKPDLSLQLPRDTYCQAIHELQSILPAPTEDTPEAYACRDRAAMAEIASLLPANANEVNIAVRCVAAHAQAMDNIRLARKYFDDTKQIMQCNAQSASMMRQANAARSLLMRVQTERRKREADGAEINKAAWTEHCAIGLMADVLGEPPPAPEPERQEPEEKFAGLSEVELYAVNYPRRVALIRANGGVPDNCTFGPPSPELVHAILTSTSPVLLELDRPPDVVAAA